MNPGIRTALVTGGAQGIGAAIVGLLLDHGWHVAIVDRDTSSASGMATAFPDKTILIETDIRAPDAARDACDRVVSDWGQLDLLVNNAGVNRVYPLEEFPLAEWEMVLDINLNSAMLFMQAASRYMLPVAHGVIVNITSIAAARGVPGRAAYAAAKAGLVSLTQSAAIEWAARGIRVNAVAPGFTETAMVKTVISSGEIALEPMLARTPLHRLADPAEIARVVLFLASEDSSFVTGQVIYVDGGFIADYGVPANLR